MNRVIFLLPLILALLVSGTAEAKKKKYPNGDYYEGKMKKDRPNGFGRMYYANGNFYEGNWVNGVANGQGRFIIKSPIPVIAQDKSKGPISKLLKTNGVTTYEGIWQNGSIIEGKMIDAENNVYEGTFEAMEFLEGKMTYANGAWISGTWKDGKIYNGDSNGNIGNGTFNGKWVNGKFMDGYCKAVGDNFSYTGRILEGIPFTGNGKVVSGENSYDGKWENGKFFGKCKVQFPSSGQFGVKSFEGTINMDGSMSGLTIYTNGDRYRGEIKDSQRNGKGVFVIKKPIVTIEGEWLNNNLVTGKGYIVYSANDYSFTVGNNQGKYEVKVKNPYNYQASFQLSNEMKLDNLISEIGAVVKSKLLLTEERLEKYRRAEDARILSQVKTFRGEHYGIGKMTVTPVGVSQTVFLYDFYDVEYQFYPQATKDIFYGKFHAWNGRYYGDWDMLYSVEGNYRKGIKEGTWIFEEEEKRHTGVGFAKRRLTINYLHDKKNGWCTLECFTSSGSRSVIKAYYKNDVWYNKGTQYYYHFGSTERNVSFDANGKVHGDVYLREGDIELKETYEHGRLIKSEKRNVAKDIVLSPKRGENRFQEMWKLILPTDYPKGTYVAYDYRVDRDPLIGLTYFDLTDEGGEYDDQYIRRKKGE